MGRTILERQTIHLDLGAVSPDEMPIAYERARRSGNRTSVATPMMRQGEAIGTIMIRRRHVEAFTETQIAALEAFAAQAVIAIENARLCLQELQESNRQVTQALEQQTATAEILRVIAAVPDRSPDRHSTPSPRRPLAFARSDNAAIERLEGEIELGDHRRRTVRCRAVGNAYYRWTRPACGPRHARTTDNPRARSATEPLPEQRPEHAC